jgi:hypothetical protein
MLINDVEFNTFADSIAAARVYALTSPNPKTTMPPVPPAPPGTAADAPPPPFLVDYPGKLSRQLSVTLFPLGSSRFLQNLVKAHVNCTLKLIGDIQI